MGVGELLALAEVDPHELLALPLGYTESAGNPVLRALVAARHERVSAEQVLVLGTPIEGIYLTGRVLLEPGDEVVVLSPAYDALYNLFAHIVGVEHVRQWWMRPTAVGTPSSWQLDWEALPDLLTPQTKLIVVNFPHNPTGFLPTPEELAQLVAICAQQGIWLFCDEMYFGLVHNGTQAIPSAADMGYERVVVLSGLSKTHGLPGLRTGWLIVRDEATRADFLNWKFYTSICPPAPSEFLAQAALKAETQLRQRNLALIHANLAHVAPFFARWPSLFTWRPPQAGSTALVGFDVPSVAAFAHQMVQAAGVLIQPATTLGYDDSHFRLGLGRRALPEALAQFEAYLSAE